MCAGPSAGWAIRHYHVFMEIDTDRSEAFGGKPGSGPTALALIG